jgi:alkylation response protein AidB-like acyl-CoA dehydrogenase
MNMVARKLSEEQRLMRQSCRAFVTKNVIPFIRANWQREWLIEPNQRLPREILEAADRIGIRTLGVPEEFGGVQLDTATEIFLHMDATADFSRFEIVKAMFPHTAGSDAGPES